MSNFKHSPVKTVVRNMLGKRATLNVRGHQRKPIGTYDKWKSRPLLRDRLLKGIKALNWYADTLSTKVKHNIK